jgi:hypothetical protein
MPLDRDWEKFNGGPNLAIQNRIHITMNKAGLIYMNGNARRMMGAPEAVQLFFNRKKDSIALKPAHARLKDVFPLRKQKTSSSFRIHANSFCANFGIKLDGVERFVDPDIDNEGILHLDLSTTVKVSGTRRNRRK